jgi:hypothetical protein
MNTKPTPRVGSHAVLVALCSCLLAGPLFAQQKDYQEAHVYITAPGASPTTGPVSPAVEIDVPSGIIVGRFEAARRPPKEPCGLFHAPNPRPQRGQTLDGARLGASSA